MLRLLSRAPSLGPPEVFQYPLLRARDDLPLTPPLLCQGNPSSRLRALQKGTSQSELASNGLITRISDPARDA
jgi:hypothetical protein